MANTHSIDLEASSSQYLSIANASQTNLNITGNFTLEAWIKIESFVPNSAPYIAGVVSKGYQVSSQNSQYYIKFVNSGTEYLRFGIDTGGSSYRAVWTYTSGTDLVVDTWYHIAGIYNGTTYKLYVDGVEKASTTSSVDPASNSQPFTIGCEQTDGTPDRYFDGLIDDVRIWNDARTTTEITDNMSTELVGDEAGLVGYWKLNNSLLDETSNDNDLTNNNSATFSTDVPFSGSSIKSINGLAKASIKSRNGCDSEY